MFVVGKFLVGDARPLIVLVGSAGVYYAFVIGFVRLYVCVQTFRIVCDVSVA